MDRTYKKEYKDPHEKLKAAFVVLLAFALSVKQKLILLYIADHGSDGLLDYAESVLDSGWDKYWVRVTALLASAATESTLETLDASGAEVSDGFIANIEKHTEAIAKAEAASLLGLSYDPTRDVAVPASTGWKPSDAMVDTLETTLEKAKTEEWTDAQVETAVEEMSAFSPERAELLARNAISLVDGQAARQAASATGANEKRSQSAHDDRVCPMCVQNYEDGWIGINERFSGSHTEDTPHHKSCRCGVEYRWASIPEIALAS